MTQNRFVITEFWQQNHNSSLKVYYSDEIDVVTKSVTKNWDLSQQKIRQQRQKVFIAKVDTINKTGSVFSLKPQEFFQLIHSLCAVYSLPFSTVLHRAPSPPSRSSVRRHQAHLTFHSLHRRARRSPESPPHLHHPFSTLLHTLAKFFLFGSLCGLGHLGVDDSL